MATSFGALCSDFYINSKLALKMDLPSDRETVLHFYDRIRKSYSRMDRFRRYGEELSLESSRRDHAYRWLSMRRHAVRAGDVNPETLEAACRYHALILKQAPYHLSISPLDVDHIELLMGFDLECQGNHDEIVHAALFEGTPLGSLMDIAVEEDGHEAEVKATDVQPVFGMSLGKGGELQASFEVKTRRRSRRGSTRAYAEEPISIFLTLRRYGPIESVDELPKRLEALAKLAEQLAHDKLVPDLLTPIAQQISGRPA